MHHKILLFSLSIAVLVLSSAHSHAEFSVDQKQAFHAAIQHLYESQKMVGVQGAVFSNGQIVTSVNLGYSDLEHQTATTDNTRFEVASITKAFTGLALLTLANEGKINLSDSIQSVVPEFPKKAEGEITIAQLSGALGGIRHYREDEKTPAFHAKHYEDVVDALALFQDDPLVAKPGETTKYSSYGYNLLAAAIQNASGQRFQSYILDTILTPLGLVNTGFVNVRRPLQNRSRTYTYIDAYSREPLDHLSIVPTMEHSYNMGGGNMYSSARDLAKFGGQFLKPGFIPAAVWNQLYEPHIEASGRPGYFSDGWLMFGLAQSPNYLMTGGSYPGTIALLLVYPEQDTVIAFVSNTWGPDGGMSFGGDNAVGLFTNAMHKLVAP